MIISNDSKKSKKRRIKVLISTQYYLPGFRGGGSLRTAANMVDQLGDDIEFYIVTGDRDASSHSPYQSVETDIWHTIGKARVYYISAKKLTLKKWIEIINHDQYDIIYLNSALSFYFTIKVLILNKLKLIKNTKLILAPRGELSEGALSVKSKKKNLFLMVSKILRLYKNIVFHASSKHEKKDIINVINSNTKVIQAIDLVCKPASKCSEVFKRKNQLKLIYYSRITPVKNLKYTLLAISDFNKPCTLDIYGPIDDLSYWNECKTIIEKMDPKFEITYRGEVAYSQVENVFTSGQFFILTTLGENYGHVIYESLANCCPIIISNKTMWKNISKYNVGWDVNISQYDAIVNVLQAAYKMDNQTYQNMRASCQKYAIEHIKFSEGIAQNISLFETVSKNYSKDVN